jgi:putative transposase
MYLIPWLLELTIYWFYCKFKSRSCYRVTKKVKDIHNEVDKNSYRRNSKKPEWVIDKVIYLKAMMPNHGCGKIAATFNRLYFKNDESVSKTFVYEKLKVNKYQLAITKRNIKKKPPYATRINRTWGVDLTTVNLSTKQQIILGIIDHGSRLNLSLKHLKSKHSANIMLELINVIRQFGFPVFIRTDNEHCFTSLFMRLALTLLGIKHQKSDIACPWQNGRIERFFGTFKVKFKQLNWSKVCPNYLQAELSRFQVWYNCVRIHENLNYQTPTEFFTNREPKGKAQLISDWDGVLCGYYFPD